MRKENTEMKERVQTDSLQSCLSETEPMQSCLSEVDPMRGYLSEAELQALIGFVEREDMVEAPPDLLEDILERLPEQSDAATAQTQETERSQMRDFAQQQSDTQRQTRTQQSRLSPAAAAEFRRFRARVILTVAASLLIMALAPAVLPGLPKAEKGFFETVGSSHYLEQLAVTMELPDFR